jgi:hypothetical protein
VPTVLLIAATFAAFAVLLGGLARLARRSRGRRLGGAVAGPFEELWHPAAHRSRVVVEVQDERTVPSNPAGDPADRGPEAPVVLPLGEPGLDNDPRDGPRLPGDGTGAPRPPGAA